VESEVDALQCHPNRLEGDHLIFNLSIVLQLSTTQLHREANNQKLSRLISYFSRPAEQAVCNLGSLGRLFNPYIIVD
jgi:hypothetical protein